MPEYGAYTPPEKASHPEYYWKASGEKQGDFKNSNPNNNAKYKAYSRVFTVHWGAEQSADQHTGLATGRHIMEPFKVTKYVDGASPQLMQAMLSHEVIKQSEFLYVDYPQSQGGKAAGAQAAAQMTDIYKIIGKQGFILKIEAGSTAEGRLLETIHITFNTMTWESIIGQTQADWDRSGQH